MILGLSGYAQSGKDTAAKALITDGWTRIAFADTLRNCLYALDPVIPLDSDFSSRLRRIVDHEGWDAAKQYPEVRRLLQYLGTEVGREILGENIWVDTTLKDLDPARNYVVTDVRFLNEADAIHKLGGTLVRVHRRGVEAVNGHVSDHALDDYPHFDYHVHNNDSVEELHHLIRTIIGTRYESKQAKGNVVGIRSSISL